MKYINFKNIKRELNKFKFQKTFPYIIVDNFFNSVIAKQLANEFPSYNDKNLH